MYRSEIIYAATKYADNKYADNKYAAIYFSV